ncbi:ferritin family protein [candidate division KSB1 bacterium]|nr:ferritin family protein [candidate division KSB1 bacterium]
MNELKITFKDALEIAITEEIKAYSLYNNLSAKVKNAATRTMLHELADQELGHRKLLENVVAGQKYEILGKNVSANQKGIVDFLVISDLKENASPQEVMIFAIKAEEKAYNFYTDFKNHFGKTELGQLFAKLATEEQGHKTKLETEYEEHFMRDN